VQRSPGIILDVEIRDIETTQEVLPEVEVEALQEADPHLDIEQEITGIVREALPEVDADVTEIAQEALQKTEVDIPTKITQEDQGITLVDILEIPDVVR